MTAVESSPTPDPEGPSRRNLLRGAAVGGAVLWTAPVVQVITMSVADAASRDLDQSGQDQQQDQQQDPVTYDGPSHGLLAFTVGGVLYAAKVDGNGDVTGVREHPLHRDVQDSEHLHGVRHQGKPLSGWADGSALVRPGGRGAALDGVISTLFLTLPTPPPQPSSDEVHVIGAWTADGRKGAAGLDYVEVGIARNATTVTFAA